MKSLLFAILLSFSFPAYSFDIVDADRAEQLYHKKQQHKKYVKCLKFIYKNIERKANKGGSYIHLPVPCADGRNTKRLIRDLRKRGYTVRVQEVGIRGVHFEDIFTISWLWL